MSGMSREIRDENPSSPRTPLNANVMLEASKLLNTGNWADEAEEEEWKLKTKKGYRPLNKVQDMPSPRARGVKRQEPWSYVEEIVNEFNPEFLCIAEPLIRPPTGLPSLLGRLGFGAKFVHNDIPNKVRNIWVFWKEELTVQLIAFSNQHITVKIGGFLMSFVHARSSYESHRSLWEELSQLGLNAEAWAVVGDFNVISTLDERKWGRTPCSTATNEFNNFIHSNALVDTTKMGLNLKEVIEKSWVEPLNDVPTRKNIKEMNEELDLILQDQEVNPFDSHLHKLEFEKVAEIQEAMKVDTMMAKEKSRVTETLEGERNTAFFHASHKD
ncbi:hypothetical protein IFM89_004803 [Coptis chinensis]|uniref:Endonuclease/exonuclease/phosphatase domain-containing protein n=1 Tax=Coptis chinensis TaxID=261450 RepID=A0A835M3U4_9MAGN|nr:hypothetical protein IFM89_004803 [Coptis chinensis]